MGRGSFGTGVTDYQRERQISKGRRIFQTGEVVTKGRGSFPPGKADF
jgi:hypothetical protein